MTDNYVSSRVIDKNNVTALWNDCSYNDGDLSYVVILSHSSVAMIMDSVFILNVDWPTAFTGDRCYVTEMYDFVTTPGRFIRLKCRFIKVPCTNYKFLRTD